MKPFSLFQLVYNSKIDEILANNFIKIVLVKFLVSEKFNFYEKGKKITLFITLSNIKKFLC